MGVGVTIRNKNLAKEGAWRPIWHPVTMTETAGIGKIGARTASRTRGKRSARRRRRARARRKRAAA